MSTKVESKKIELVLATKNPGKLKELLALSALLQTEQSEHSKLELDLHLAPDEFDPEETGDTFIANAVIKAQAAAQMTGKLSLADDSGLTVEAMDGRPGIYSARYCAGTDADRRTKLLGELKDVPVGKRQAAFVCAMALVSGSGETLFTCHVDWQGVIDTVEKGSNGFGFDPLFVPDGYDITTAEMDSAIKNSISHRGQAFQQVLNYLRSSDIATH